MNAQSNIVSESAGVSDPGYSQTQCSCNPTARRAERGGPKAPDADRMSKRRGSIQILPEVERLDPKPLQDARSATRRLEVKPLHLRKHRPA